MMPTCLQNWSKTQASRVTNVVAADISTEWTIFMTSEVADAGHGCLHAGWMHELALMSRSKPQTASPHRLWISCILHEAQGSDII